MKKLFLLAILFTFAVKTHAQDTSPKEQETDEIIDGLLEKNQNIDALLKSISKLQFLYLSMNYNNKTYFSGRDIGVNQYNLTPKISYMHSSGIYASLSGIYYSEFDPNWDLTTASIGFGKDFGKQKKLRYNGSYSRYFYNNSLDNAYNNVINAGLAFRNKKRNFSSQLSLSYLFGNQDGLQIASTNYLLINLIKTAKAQLSLKPQLSIVAGNQTIELARNYFFNGHPVTVYTTNSTFDLINTQINFPLDFNYKSFDFELGYNFNFPNALKGETDVKNTSYFNFSVAYLINL
ncbi:hypothetical protein SAMN05192550_0660 [Flavobacterium glycines]|uniref:DUF481 domain-containing protein n=1 Tax=Flavobacterium glycines TaxID=551990 RepID=A0A1B9DNN1_9FLAO|nr:hypothetical protein [Flavobacterium glycines]OCB71298.1 hypothetical protein FBGL_08595 [Flavobacterium glycines]GEL10308.1 hypothetical protein FGL01_10470 [Flavobacterium glycines]SDI72877.1 hypothetical protein SAMN05192550_0660 [Flavobacterium glycines]